MLAPPASIRRVALGVLGMIAVIPSRASSQRPDSVTISLRSGPVVLSQRSTAAFWEALRAGSSRRLHGMLWLSHSPSPLERDSLLRLGIEILAPLQHGVFWAAITANADTVHAALRPRFYAKLDARARVAPEVWSGEVGRYSLRQVGGDRTNYVLNADSTLNIAVVFHPGTPIAEADQLLRSRGRNVARLSDIGWKVTATLADVRRLAETDAVRWIDAAPPPTSPDNDNTRLDINVEALQNFNIVTGQVQGLGGNGITVGVFDYGIDQAHPDFGTRVVLEGITTMSTHATHIGGVIGGDGIMSTGVDSWTHANGGTSYQYRGMAPQAHLIDELADNSFTAAVVSSYITGAGMDISNHSYTYSLNGEYGPVTDAFHDQLIRGDATNGGSQIPAREHVYSSGNSGTKPGSTGQQQIGYFSLSKQSKNGIVVGNYDHQTHEVDPSSSLGPAYDGRIKPDVVAPGTNIRSPGYCTTTNDIFGQCVGHPNGVTSRRNFYSLLTGSSPAAAAVTGMLALVLQQFKTSYGAVSPGWVLRPSTLRAVTIHSAHDLFGSVWYWNEDGPVQAFPGPDFVSGYGLVDAKDAVALIANGQFVQDAVPTECDVQTWWIYSSGGAELKVTLAWDDLPGDAEEPFTDPRLKNDLDLEVVAPNSTVYYPWLLDQTAMSGGVAVPDAAQSCGSDLTVARKVLPTTTPNFVGVGNPANSNDLLSGGVLQPATTGKDHLNNVEQVVVAGPADGWWKIRVTGFKVASPQPFSLVSTPAARIRLPVVPPAALCWTSPNCAKMFYDARICFRIPKICSPMAVIPGQLPVSFVKSGEAVFVPLDRLCLFLVQCPACLRDGICRQLSVIFAHIPSDFTVTLFDSTGTRVFADKTSQTTKRLSTRIAPEGQYVLAIQAGPSVKPHKRYDLKVRAGGS
ncbi:MAG: S8 family serine peptidase [Gemmatimonadaceae bacterium]